MVSRFTPALVAALALAGPLAASAKEKVEPRPGVLLSGTIQFPREQSMSVHTGDGSRLTATLGFHGKCKGGGLSEVWATNVPARPTVRVRNGRFSARVTGVARSLGGVEGRAGHFRWRFRGRFVDRDVVKATVAGRGEVRVNGRTVAKCRIASPATVRLAVRSAR